MLQVVERFGSLQFDPLEVPGARNHDLVLHARVGGYQREHCDALLYDERSLFEAYNKSLNLLPTSELPWHRVTWRRTDIPRTRKLLADHPREVRAILRRIREEGPLAPSAFDDTVKITGYWGTSTSLSRHLLEGLFFTGKVGLFRRDGNKRVYELTERLHPPELLSRKVPDEEAHLYRLLSRHRAVGLMGEGGASELTYGTGPAAARARRVRLLVDRGLLVPVEVEGVRGTRFVLAGERGLLGEPGPAPCAVTFLAPLDPFMWDRRLVRELFGFEYIWEVYTPAVKRKYGYYALPVLFGDRLVGRVEPRFDRSTRTLHVARVWWERGACGEEVSHAFGEALSAYREFVGAERVTFGRTKDTAALARYTRAS